VISAEAIKKLETSNQHLQTIIDHLDEQLADIRSDPRLEDLVDDLEQLFYTYLKTWIKSNSEVIEILSKDSK
jgi:vacuolar-type H+-ATPase subunit E/Vma4